MAVVGTLPMERLPIGSLLGMSVMRLVAKLTW